MRVTNAMIFGNSLNNIFRNVRHVNGLVQQIETKKLIQRPSDNPILSARSLRYRTILGETEQFLANANSGMAWMDASEAAFMNLLQGEDSALQEINRRLVAAASGSHTLDDRRAMVTELREFFDQIALEMNQVYMGRYVFSGFYTNQPPILTTDMQGRSFVITQEISAANIQQTRSFQNLPPDGRQPVLHSVNIINLPYRDIDAASLSVLGFHVIERGIRDENAYTPIATTTVGAINGLSPGDVDPDYDETPVPILHFIPETGELVMHADTARDFPQSLNITYRVDNPRAGELNPIVYFNSREVERNAAGVWVNKEPVTTHSYNTADHQIRIEMAAANHLTVNSLAREIVTPAMFSDLLSLFEFVENLTPSDERAVRAHYVALEYTGQNLDDAVSRFMSDEEARVMDVLHVRFSQMLKHFTTHKDIVQREHTSLGSRMGRVDMLVIRLEEEEVNYTALLSANEDTPLQNAIMQKAAAEAAFQAALRANAMIVQLSLVNFLR
jgi:flagellin-like hook-associated protein FlgL